MHRRGGSLRSNARRARATRKVAARETADEHEIKGEREVLTLNLGEGWRSIATAVLKKYPTSRVVGVDRRGFTWTSFARGYIAAEVHHDWSQKSSASTVQVKGSKVRSTPGKGTRFLGVHGGRL